MESDEKITEPVTSATNESADNNEEVAVAVAVAADHGAEPSSSNIQSSQDDQHLRSLLTSLLKDQLVEILVLLSMKFPQAADRLRAASRPTASHRKLIVHGLSEQTTLQTLTQAFSNAYGQVEDANLTIDRTTGKSLGFGFVTFKTLESIKKALEKQKTWVDGHLARQHPPSEAEIDSADLDQRKLFVSRISSVVTNDMFYRFFEKYGEIEESSLFYNRGTGTSRGLGFVIFKTVEAAQAAISDPDKNLGGNRISVEIKRFIKTQNEVREDDQESVSSNINAPQIRNRNPYAIINRPSQHYGTSRGLGFVRSRDVRRHPQLIRGRPTYQPPTRTYQPFFVGGYEPAYGFPVAYQPAIRTYQPYFISGYEAYGIPVPYQAPTVAYQDPTVAYQAPTATYQDPTGAYQAPTVAYQDPTGAYQAQTGAYQDPTVAYQAPTGAYQDPTGAYQDPTVAYQAPTVAYQDPTVAYQAQTGAYQDPTVAYQDPTVAYQAPTGAYQPHFIGGNEPAYGIPLAAYQLPSSSSGVYQRPPRGFRAYPNYFPYQ